jgi:hypothetical protein
MRVVAVHGSDGRITSLIGLPANAPSAGIATLAAGERMTELDVSEITPDLGIEEIMERLADIAENHIVEAQPTAARLVRKV